MKRFENLSFTVEGSFINYVKPLEGVGVGLCVTLVHKGVGKISITDRGRGKKITKSAN